jgi:NADH-quinone oxidoreductase subunit N
MNFSQLVDQLIAQTTERSLWCFAPEIAICVTIVALLLVRLVSLDRFVPNYMFALLGTFAAFGLSLYQGYEFSAVKGPEAGTFFTGLMVYDQFTIFFRVFLLLFLILTITLTVLTGIPDNEDGPDFYTLLLGATLGMMMMSGANHLLMLFLAIEMASVPSYVMVGFLKGRKSSSEAALKYVVYGAGTAGVMLYGISLLCGLCGTGDLPALAERISLIVQNDPATMASVGMSNGTVRAIILGIVLVLVGLAFKLSLVPFHFWCPDAFEGAAAEVGGFLSVASKAGAFALLLRFVLAFCGGEPSALSEIYMYLGLGLGAVGIVTATYGNLTAYGQSNIKRMLAYSTIAHAGYMIMAVAALIVILNAPETGGVIDRMADAARAIEGLLYYLAVYMFMNLGAFAVVALIRNQTFSEEIDDYSGIAKQAPWLSLAMLICMFSLIGMPPFGGFFAKLMIFASVYQAGAVHWFMYVVLVFGGLNTVFSLFYYIRVLKTMFIGERPSGAQAVKVGFQPSLYVMTLAVFVLFLGVVPQWMQGLSSRASGVAKEALSPQAQVQPAESNTVIVQDAR